MSAVPAFIYRHFCYDIDFTKQDVDEAYRKSLYDFANEHGNHALHEKLKDIDPASYKSIHENNVKRVIRQLNTITPAMSRFQSTMRQKEPSSLHTALPILYWMM